MEVMVTTGAVRSAKLQSNRDHQQINTQLFYRPDALPVAQRTVSKHRNHPLYLQYVCFATTGTYGAAVTFVSGKKERETLVRFAEICNMCIRALPGEWLLVLNWQHSVLLWSLRLLTCWYIIIITIIINWRAPWKNRIRSTSVKQKITRKASDAAEYIELFGSFTRDRRARRI